LALELLAEMKIPADGARSKSWDEFVRAPEFDFVITVCDSAAGQICPIWPGKPVTAHWDVDDPAAASGTVAQKMMAFHDAFCALAHRIRAFVNLPTASMDRVCLQRALDDIGRQRPES
jgi:arsenate reductase